MVFSQNCPLHRPLLAVRKNTAYCNDAMLVLQAVRTDVCVQVREETKSR